MQLSLFDDLHVLEEEGFVVTKTFKSSNDNKFKQLESTFSVLLNEAIVLYVQDNNDGTYNTFGFNHERFRVSLGEVIETVRNKNNWCLNDLETLEGEE